MAEAPSIVDEFPILCETCLGPNPNVRMTREKYGKACKICERAFTVFRWRPGADARYKKTELCPTCAKLKNVCQTCVLDLDYGLPVQVRDSAMDESERIDMPTSDVGLGFMTERRERDVDLHGALPYGKMNKDVEHSLLSRLQKKTPYYRRNLPHLCSFYAKGTCNRGDTCPYRHEMPTTGELAKQNIKDRFYGHNDPVANKMLRRFNQPGTLPEPPSDKTITTLWVGGVDDKTTEQDLRALFFPYGEIASVRVVPDKFCAFVTFMRRDSAEEAIAGLYKDSSLKGNKLRLDWGRSQKVAPPPGMSAAAPLVNEPDATRFLSIPAAAPAPAPVAAPPGMRGARPYYASMDPKHMASKISS